MEFGTIMLLFVIGIIVIILAGIFTANNLLINLLPVLLSLFPLILLLYPLYISKRLASHSLIFILLPWLILPIGFLSLSNVNVNFLRTPLLIIWSAFNVLLPKAQLEYFVAVQKSYLKAIYSYSESTVKTVRIVWLIILGLIIFSLFLVPIANLTSPFK